MPKRRQRTDSSLKGARGGGGGGYGSAKKKKQKVKPADDDFLGAGSDGDEELLSSSSGGGGDEDDDGEEEEYRLSSRNGARETEENGEGADTETADEKRLRVAKAYLEEIRASVKGLDEDKDGVNGDNNDDDGVDDDDDDVDEEAKRKEALGARDSLVADLLQQAQLEEGGRVQRKLASRVVEPTTPSEGKKVGRRHRQPVTAVALSEDDSKGFAASKDGLIVHWDIETGASDTYNWPSNVASGNKVVVGARGKVRKPSRNILALATSSDGRYLATGGLDRIIHLWDTRTREHLQAFPGHRGAVSSLVFRQGTQQLMSASFDRTIKLWSVEDRSYIDTLYGHQSEVLSIDCLRQERVLSAGRDRTLRIWKVPDETQLVFRGHAASLECCCFLTNTEFLSGSDDGCVALWNVLKKKPVTLIKNAHGLVHQDNAKKLSENQKQINLLDGSNCNGKGNGVEDQVKSEDPVKMIPGVEAWVGALAVCRGSDLAASGAGDGKVQLWALEEDNKHLRALHSLPVNGFVNSLAFAKSGKFLLVGHGQEPRLGRWGRNPLARNGVVLHSILPA